MSTAKRWFPRGMVLVAAAAGLIAALVIGRGISGARYGSTSVSSHHVVADNGIIRAGSAPRSAAVVHSAAVGGGGTKDNAAGGGGVHDDAAGGGGQYH